MTTVRLFRRKATNYRDAMRLTVRGNRTGAHLEHWSEGIIVSTLPVDQPANPDDLIADIRDLQALWCRVTKEGERWAARGVRVSLPSLRRVGACGA